MELGSGACVRRYVPARAFVCVREILRDPLELAV